MERPAGHGIRAHHLIPGIENVINMAIKSKVHSEQFTVNTRDHIEQCVGFKLAKGSSVSIVSRLPV